MIIPRGSGSTRQAGVTPPAPGRGPARSHPRLAAAVTMVCAVAVVGTAHHGAVPAGAAAMARAHTTALAGATAASRRPGSGLPRASGAHLPAGTPAAAGAVARAHTTALAGATAASRRPGSGLPRASGAHLPAGTPAAAGAVARAHTIALAGATAASSWHRPSWHRPSRHRPSRHRPSRHRSSRHRSSRHRSSRHRSSRHRSSRHRSSRHRSSRHRSGRHRSGLPWASGAYLPAGTPAAAAAFGAWRKRPLDVGEVWLSQSTWASITDPAWLYQQWRGSPYTLVVTVPMLPADVPRVSIQACAAGAYNAHWRQFGRVIRSYGLGSSIIRLGWEFNGKWYSWAATNPTAWAECWRQAVTAARSTAPQLRWDWNGNRGVSSALANPFRAYPGNAYVSMIGVDSYDQWPSVDRAGGWQKQLNGEQGLNYWLAFARAHGKKLSVPEWGSMRYGRSAGRDDPQYIRDMRAFFAANARYIAFEAIFQGSIGDYNAGHTMPRAAHAYQAGF